MKLSDLIDNTNSTNRVCVFGPPKCGKTKLAGMLAEMFELVFVDMEKGSTTLRQIPKEWQSRIELISLPDRKEYPVAIETILKIISGGLQKICFTHGKCGCTLCLKNPQAQYTVVEMNKASPNTILVLDSLTQLANSAMNYICKDQPIDFKPGWEEYRLQGTYMDKVLGNIQQAQFNVLCLTHEAEVTMNDGTAKIVPIAGSANFSRNTAKYFDDVVYLDVRNKKHRGGSATTYLNNVLTGSRVDAKIEEMETASLIPFFAKSLETKAQPQFAPQQQNNSPVAMEQAAPAPEQVIQHNSTNPEPAPAAQPDVRPAETSTALHALSPLQQKLAAIREKRGQELQALQSSKNPGGNIG